MVTYSTLHCHCLIPTFTFTLTLEFGYILNNSKQVAQVARAAVLSLTRAHKVRALLGDSYDESDGTPQSLPSRPRQSQGSSGTRKRRCSDTDSGVAELIRRVQSGDQVASALVLIVHYRNIFGFFGYIIVGRC
jgi:hypothetical protein